MPRKDLREETLRSDKETANHSPDQPAAEPSVVFHPSSSSVDVEAEAARADGDDRQRLRQHGRGWHLDGDELFNGCFIELRLTAPALWLPVAIRGLPDAAAASFAIAGGRAIELRLSDGMEARWPRGGIDQALVEHALDDRTGSAAERYSQTSATKPK